MKKVVVIVSVFILLTAALIYSSNTQLKAARLAPQETTPIDPVFPGLGIITSRTMRDGRINTSHLGIFGPQSCVDYGDPYSPLNSPYLPGPHTYQYRIRIPADYPENIVRVELLDPDSINQAANSFTINRSNLAINNGLTAVASKTCGVDSGYTDQIQPCQLLTDEYDLVTGAPNLDLDQVNPYWFVRLDENRGAGTPPGNGTCGHPATYNPLYNTDTLFELSYYRQETNQPVEEIPLVSYVGQTGDGVRDSGDHNTDLRWVSPGADVPFSNIDDPGSSVPATAATIDSFEVDLTTDVPGILTDGQTGDRYLYLAMTALSGASENGYEIWAGPPNYVNTVPSEVNARNLYILNNPGSHDSQGLEITAVDTLVRDSNFTDPVNIPLAYIGPEYAGQTLQLSLYDADANAEPPLIFFFDTVAFTPDDTNPLGYDPSLTDWAMAFGVAGQDDPDGVAEGVRCLPGGCYSQWVDPPYQITIPGDLSNCDWQNPTPETCTPFYGGRLMARYDGGVTDTSTWDLSLVSGGTPTENTAGCSAFPIAIQEGVRSVSAPGIGGSNPYPNATEFSYPLSPPTYESFTSHQADVPLLNATPGDIFRLYNGSGSGNFGWLVWNTGVSANADTLVHSLTWPGDSTDYSPCSGPGCPGGAGIPGSGFPSNVRGYIEPDDPTDQALRIGDWIAASTGSISSVDVRSQLGTHIDLERTLRLPVWGSSTGTGVDGRFQTSQFAIFRLIGYNIANNWLLLEFVNFDTSCGQLPVAPTSMSVAGPTTGDVATSYSFTATVNPGTATMPITYTWEITDHDTITNTGGISNTIMLDWISGGNKTVTVTAVNSSGIPVNQSHTINITMPDVAADLVTITGPTSGAAHISYDFTATINPLTTTTPVTYTWEITGYDTITNTGSLTNTVSLSWASGGSKSVTVTAVNNTGLSVSQTHTIDITIPEKLLYLPIIIKTE